MTNLERMKIEKIIKYSKEDNPSAIKPLFTTLIYGRISDLLEKRKEEIKKEL